MGLEPKSVLLVLDSGELGVFTGAAQASVAAPSGQQVECKPQDMEEAVGSLLGTFWNKDGSKRLILLVLRTLAAKFHFLLSS